MNPLMSGLSICNTSTQRIDTPSYNFFTIAPDCTVYRKIKIKRGEEEEEEEVTRLVEFFIEFKSSAEHDPFLVATGPAPVRGNKRGQAHFLSGLTGRRHHTLSQLGTYAAIHIDSQYRAHTFLVLIIGTYARLIRWDRGGMVFTEAIPYNVNPEFFNFFKYYNDASFDVRGIDSIMTKPTDPEIQTTLGTWTSGVDDESQTFLVISLCNEAGHAQRYVIPSPYPRPSLPVGRCTRTSVAYDLQNNVGVYMKAFWRIVLNDNDIKEGEVYQVLSKANVRNIPRCVAFCDFQDQYHQTQTHTFAGESWLPQGYEYLIPHRRLHCLILDTEGKKLEDFTTSKEMVRAIHAAIIGTGLPGCDFICQTLTCDL